MQHSRTRMSCILAALALAAGAGSVSGQETAPVQATLKPGANLLAISGTPTATAPEQFFAPLTANDDLISVWSYDSAIGWERWPAKGNDKPLAPDGVPAPARPKELTEIRPGRAYFVTLKDAVPKTGVAFEYAVRLKATPLALTKGWNFVGFGGDQALPVEAVFLDTLKNVTELQRLNAKGDFEGRNANTFTTVTPGQGYWVQVKADTVLAPKLELVLPEDLTFPARLGAKAARRGDTDYNRNGLIDALTQDTLYVGPLQSASGLLVRAGGEGVLQFGARADAWWRAPGGPDGPYPPVISADLANGSAKGWVPAGMTGVPWLMLTPATASSPTLAAAPAVVSRDRAAALRVNRVGLTPGHYLARVRVASTGGARSVYVVATVAAAGGDYEGHANVRVINARPDELRRAGHPSDLLAATVADGNRDRVAPPIEVAKIGLRLCLTEEADKPLLGVIDRDGSLVFPTDVPLVGTVTDPAKRRFVLSGAFTLAPRDGANPAPPPRPRESRTRSRSAWSVASRSWAPSRHPGASSGSTRK